jgi:uridine phosphorylase
MKQIPESELILNKDGSIYHLNLHPEEISDLIINVGDPDRVEKVSRYFEKIELKKQKREFVTHTGYYQGKRISVISTGIGTDNIDIVYNELDALANIDFKTRMIRERHRQLTLVRIGTSGALQSDIPVDSFVFSTYGLGLDGLLNFYNLKNDDEENKIILKFREHYPTSGLFARSYVSKCSSLLETILSEGMAKGITVSCSGFYGPQGRVLRLSLAMPDMLEKLNSFSYQQHRITNFEMETGAMYGLSKLLGHHCCSVNVIVANRLKQQFSKNADSAMDKLIVTVLDRMK